MNPLAKLYQWAKTLHRTALFGMVGLGLVMGFTGSLLKFTKLTVLIPGINVSFIRYLHNEFSPFFSVFLGLMILSGLYMYWYPWYTQKQAQKRRAAMTNENPSQTS